VPACRLKAALLLLAMALSAMAADKQAPQADQQHQHKKQDVRGLEGAVTDTDGTQTVHKKIAGNGTLPAAPKKRVITGVVAPGNSPGCVTDQGNVVFEGGASLQIELGGTTPCTGYDQYTVNLSLTLNSPTLIVTLYNGYVPKAGDSFDILNWGTLSGTFGTVTLPTLAAPLVWDVSQLYTTGQLNVINPAAAASGDVPLPAWALLLLGGSLLGIMRRKT
jgi:hypothetical protein